MTHRMVLLEAENKELRTANKRQSKRRKTKAEKTKAGSRVSKPLEHSKVPVRAISKLDLGKGLTLARGCSIFLVKQRGDQLVRAEDEFTLRALIKWPDIV